ncbi:hypothetical protein RHGRI_026378 [Rhododendron griersonianum]|uniref:Uncharacterized protein n=1 Tax=Rhododendron griersonianum TaxID=479676 RepID=A0AAV6ISH6_9ERIC|nr:hypothetical protein RHGRI_026378 [Rhododendron griersonianum]
MKSPSLGKYPHQPKTPNTFHLPKSLHHLWRTSSNHLISLYSASRLTLSWKLHCWTFPSIP